MKVKVEVDRRQLSRVQKELAAIGVKIPRVLAAAVNETTKQQKTKLSKQVRQFVNIKKKDIDPHITYSRANAARPGSVFKVNPSKRLPLKYFGARQTKRGVTYRISKLGKGRRLVRGAFGPKIPRLGGHAFKRRGRKRLPIRKLHGPSAWGVIKTIRSERHIANDMGNDLRAKIDRRTNFELLKAKGLV